MRIITEAAGTAAYAQALSGAQNPQGTQSARGMEKGRETGSAFDQVNISQECSGESRFQKELAARLVQDILPVGLRGLVLAGLIAVLMSSMSACYNSSATLVVRDFVLRYRPGISESGQLKAGRWVTLLMAVLGVAAAPLVGLSEVIVDLVESGRTLKENGLVVLDTIAEISARMVVNRVSMKMESERINAIIDGLKKQL